MAKSRTIFVCQQCGAQQARWMGKCPDCNTWDSLVEQTEVKLSSRGSIRESGSAGARPIRLRDVPTSGFQRLPVYTEELARVLGGGLVPGSVVLIGGDPGVGKCVTGDTRVLDPESGALLPITAWAAKQRSVLALDSQTHRLFPVTVTAYLDQGVQPIVRLTTRLGRQLRCTPTHPVLTPEGWKPVGTLTPGDRIATPRALPYFGNYAMHESEVKLIAYVLSDGSAQSSLSVTTTLSEVEADLHTIAEFFGMHLRVYAKRGSRASSYKFVMPLGVRSAHRKVVAAALRRVQSRINITWAEWARRAAVPYAKLNSWRRGRTVPSALNLRQLADSVDVQVDDLAGTSCGLAEMTSPGSRLIASLGLRYSRARSKVVPNVVFELPLPHLAVFLRTLFTCDGSVYVNNDGKAGVSYSSISRRLAEDVQHLLLRFGLVAKLCAKHTRVNDQPYIAYEVQLLGIAAVRRFLNHIGIMGREEAKARIAMMPEPVLASTHFDTVPTGLSFWHHVREVAGPSFKLISAKTDVTIRNRRHNRPLCRNTVAALADAYPSAYLQTLAYGSVYWDEVVAVEPAGEERVYDLTVPGPANFVANDLIVHNSTLLGQVAAHFAANVGAALYVSAEESAQQIKLRAERLGMTADDLYVYSETSLDTILQQIRELRPGMVIIDSIQTVYLEDLTSAAGSVAQVREGALRLMQLAKELGIPIFLVGHVTKEGAIAGPRVLEHIVDVVLYLEGDRFHQYRLLRGVKNRFGSTNEVGVFEMAGDGLREVPNPSQVFLAERSMGSPGSTVAVMLEGTRPLLVEVQALTSTTGNAQPRRTTNGFDLNRLLMLVAVLTKRVGLPLFNQDVYVNIVGGLRIGEPAADLAVALAIASSYRNQRIESDLVLIGEVGLSGELRSVSQLDRRLTEAAKLGFTRAVVPATAQVGTLNGLSHIPARSLAEVVDLLARKP
ncbi:MAG: DNA repair protein RadA [Chloroflexales bacterium]